MIPSPGYLKYMGEGMAIVILILLAILILWLLLRGLETCFRAMVLLAGIAYPPVRERTRLFVYRFDNRIRRRNLKIKSFLGV